MTKFFPALFLALFLALYLMATGLADIRPTSAQEKITSPKAVFGHNLGDDYFLANNTQMVAYWRELERESDRMKLEVIGESEEGREMLMAIVSSPKNIKNLQQYKKISHRLAMAKGLNDDKALKLAAKGKAVVWIDGGLHATEVLVAQQLTETIYQLVSANDPETLRFLDDVIVLFCNPNPDGLELVANWYMRNEIPEERSSRSLPRLYQKYIGHDNNRDFYMITQKETEAICRVFYHDWHPQIVYNHHQSGPSGTVLFAPPFRDPFNHNYDPLVPIGIDLVGASMHSRFIVEGKPGATMRKGASYSTWWNGGLRTNVYFHNMIGLLTETIGHPTPMEIPLRIRKQMATADLPFPVAPQTWHFRQSVDYSVTANKAVLDVASRHREQFLFNSYRMGKNSIDRGSKDHWTIRPKRIEAAEAASASSSRSTGSEDKLDVYKEVLHAPEFRDPRGYVITADQSDFLTATKFVNTLIKGGITVHQANKEFEVAGKKYPPNSYVIKTAQAFRPHIIDMFEPQDHPNDFPYPGGPPIAPYDSAGWTLALQMGIEFDRVLEGFDGPFQRIKKMAKVPEGSIGEPAGAAGFLLDRRTNDSFIALNRMLKAGLFVQQTNASFELNANSYPAGTFYISKKADSQKVVTALAEELGLQFLPVGKKPDVEMTALSKIRVGLWDRYGGSMASGWTRWILEKYEFDFDVVYPEELDAGSLVGKFDAIIFVGGSIPSSRSSRGRSYNRESIPEEFHDRLGSVTTDKTIPQLKSFLEAGGTILTVGSGTVLYRQLELPIQNPLVERLSETQSQAMGRDKYYVPGSVLKVRVDNTNPVAYGLSEQVNVYFNNNPVFRLAPEAILQGIRPVAWFDSSTPLLSGWAWGQHHLKDSLAVVEAPLGDGTLLMFGPEITFRAQPHGTFKFLFNGLYFGASKK